MKSSCGKVIYTFLLQALLAAGAGAACVDQAPSPVCGSTPSAVFNANGDLLVVFVAGQHVYLSRSVDNGASYDSAVQINAEPEDIYADGENRPVLALGQAGQIYVAWTRQNSALYSGDIRFARSTDQGRHFDAVRTVNDDGLLTSHRFVSMATAQNGTVFLAWLDKRDQLAALAQGHDYVGAALYYTTSVDAGSSFAANRKVADNSCECCRLALAPAGADRMQALWRHVFENGQVRDHAIATLDALPAADSSFPIQPHRASFDQWYLEGCPHHGPAMVEADGGYHLSWFTNGNAQQGVIYGFYDSGSGLTTQVHTIDPLPAGGHPAINVKGATVTIVWKSFNGKQMQLKYAQSLDSGKHWLESKILATTQGASDHPLFITKGTTPWLAWHTADEGYQLLPLPELQSGVRL